MATTKMLGNAYGNQPRFDQFEKIGAAPKVGLPDAYGEYHGVGSSSSLTGGSAGGAGGGFGDLLAKYEAAYAKANAANESRYQDIKGRYEGMNAATRSTGDAINQAYGDRYNRNMGYLRGQGTQEAADIRKAYMNADRTTQQRLTDQGLAGTTVGATMAAGNLRNQTSELGRLNERLNNQYLGADMQLSGDQLGAQATNLNRNNAGTQSQLDFMERRTDQLPDLGQYISLAQAQAAAGPQPYTDNGVSNYSQAVPIGPSVVGGGGGGKTQKAPGPGTNVTWPEGRVQPGGTASGLGGQQTNNQLAADGLGPIVKGDRGALGNVPLAGPSMEMPFDPNNPYRLKPGTTNYR